MNYPPFKKLSMYDESQPSTTTDNTWCACLQSDPKERNGHSASCNREQRRSEKELLKPKKKPVKINKVSDKMAKELTIYAKKKEKHLADHPDCQIKLIGCTNRNNTVHHSARRGKNMNNEATFKTAYDYCHHQIEFVLSAKENRERGFLV